MDAHEGPTCVECKGRVFKDYDDGQLVCVVCLTAVADHVETVLEFGLSQGRSTSILVKKRGTQDRTTDKNKSFQQWTLYDAFNFILVKMTNELIKCGASPKIKDCVHQLWASYLFKVGVIKPRDPDEFAGIKQVEDNEEPSIIPEWFSQTKHQESQDEGDTSLSESRHNLLFAPVKVPLKKRKKNKSQKENLMDTPDANLSAYEIRKKNRQIKESFLKIAVLGADTDTEKAEQILASGKEEDEDDDAVQLSRIATMKDAVPECFPERVTVDSILRSKKTTEFTGPKTTLKDPEYLTLHKLLSFLHAACLMKGELISYADLIRWIREGFIPLYGAHQLLPPTMCLNRADTKILGGISAGRSKGIPDSKQFRENTAKLLNLLDITLIPKPPTILVASKLLCDLQLPDDLESCISTLDKLVSKRNKDEWKLAPFGKTVNSENSYAGALVIIALKMTLGLDGATENKISNFAEQVNGILKLKPSSGFTHLKLNQDHYRPSSEMKTLFVWNDWVRFIEFRRLALERNHVPTAIRKGAVDKMDPEFVLRFSKNEGYLHCHRKTGEPSEKESQIINILDRAAARFESGSQSTKRIPVFRPCKLSTHGLAEQLVEFDRSEFGLLEQTFSRSSLEFALEPKMLARELKRENHRLMVCLGPAHEEVNLSMPFIGSGKKMSKMLGDIDRYGWKRVKLNPFLVDVTMSDEENAENDENEDESQPKLMMYHPSSIYWSRACYCKNMSNMDWAVFSAELPSIFLWVLNLVSEAIEEAPKDLYVKLYYLETIIFLRHQKLLHTLTSARLLKHRLVSAMRKEV